MAIPIAHELLDPGQLNRLGAEVRAQLGGVFPAVAGLGSHPPGLSAERHRAHYAIRALMGPLAARRPLILALDDVHCRPRSRATYRRCPYCSNASGSSIG